MTTLVNGGVPYQDPFEEIDDQDKPTGYFSRAWLNFWERLDANVSAAPTRLKRVTVPIKLAAIGVTPLPLGDLAAGLYEVRWNARVTAPAGVSSSFQVHFGYTDGGVAQAVNGAVVNGNLVTSKDLDSALLRIDKGAPITYAVDYASNPAAAMVGVLDVVVHDLN